MPSYPIDSNSDSYKVARLITSLYQKKGKNIALQAMREWYYSSTKIYSEWSKAFYSDEDDSDDILKAHIAWSEKNSIRHTPTIFYNERELPQHYQISDIRYFID